MLWFLLMATGLLLASLGVALCRAAARGDDERMRAWEMREVTR